MEPTEQYRFLTEDPLIAQRHPPGTSCAVLLDACAADVGKRVVRELDGRVRVMGFDASQQVRQADDQAHPGRRLKAGGDWYRDTL